MEMETSAETSVSEWQPIPENDFLQTLSPGQYLLHSHFVSDVGINLVLEENDAQVERVFDFVEGSIEHVQLNQLTQTIYEKFRVYNAKVDKLTTGYSLNQYEKQNLRAKLQNMNECLLKGFDSFVPVHVHDEVGCNYFENLDNAGNLKPSSYSTPPTSDDNNVLADDSDDEQLDSLNDFNPTKSSTEGSDVDNDRSVFSSSSDETLFEDKISNNLELATVSPPPDHTEFKLSWESCTHIHLSPNESESEGNKVPELVRSSVLSDSDDDNSTEIANVEKSHSSSSYTTVPGKRISISMYRLDDEIPAEELDELWRKFNNSKTMSIQKTPSNRKRRYSEMKRYNDEENIPLEIRLAFRKAQLL